MLSVINCFQICQEQCQSQQFFVLFSYWAMDLFRIYCWPAGNCLRLKQFKQLHQLQQNIKNVEWVHNSINLVWCVPTLKTHKFHVQYQLTFFCICKRYNMDYQGISWPSHAKNLPLSWLFTLLMMFNSFCTENSLVKSLPSGTFLWNGRERSVSTVPGCNRIHIAGSFFRPNSTDTVFVTAKHQLTTEL